MVRVPSTDSGAVIHNSHPRQVIGEQARHSVSCWSPLPVG